MVGLTNAGGGGGGSEGYAYVQATFPSGSTCTATNGIATLTAPNTSGLYVFNIPQPSSTPQSWTISCTNGSKSSSKSISVANQYQVDLVTLSYSRVPEGYQEVEYLQSSGTQYIKTNYNALSLDEQIEIDFMMLTNLTHAVFGFAYGTLPQHGLGNSSGLKYCWFQSTGSGPGTETVSYSSNATLNTKMTAIFNNSSHAIKENNQTLTTAALNTPALRIQQITSRMPIFCMWDYNGSYQNVGGGNTRIYKWIRTNTSSNTIIENLVPCRKTSNNTLGMYDLISDTFLTNSGSGTFTAGPDV